MIFKFHPSKCFTHHSLGVSQLRFRLQAVMVHQRHQWQGFIWLVAIWVWPVKQQTWRGLATLAEDQVLRRSTAVMLRCRESPVHQYPKFSGVSNVSRRTIYEPTPWTMDSKGHSFLENDMCVFAICRMRYAQIPTFKSIKKNSAMYSAQKALHISRIVRGVHIGPSEAI